MPYNLSKKAGILTLILVLLLGAAIKFKFLFQGSLWPDEALYLYIARNLSSNITNLTDISGEIFYKSPPLLMYLLSPFAHIKCVEFNQMARIIIILMATGTILSTYYIGKKVYHPWVGIIAASLFAVCPLTCWTSVRILTDVPVVFFIYLAIAMLVYEKKAAFYCFASCAVLTKYSAFPVLFLPLFLKLKPKTWASLYLAGFVTLGILVATKHFYPKPSGWMGYFYGFFNMPDFLQMFREIEFFLGYFLVALIVLGSVFTIKEQKYSALFHWVCMFGICRIFLPWILFRVSRYTLPLFPGLYVLAGYGCYRTVQMVVSKWPVFKKWAVLFFVVSILSVLYANSMRSLFILAHTENKFIGFKEACLFIKEQNTPHSIATASHRQIKYFAPGFDVYNIEKNVTQEELKQTLKFNDIQYLSIDLWSPHLPSWCRSFDFEKNGYKLIFNQHRVYVFKLVEKYLDEQVKNKQ